MLSRFVQFRPQLGALLFACLLLPSSATAAYLSHSGATDPQTEGFTLTSGGTQTYQAIATPEAAWQIVDSSASQAYYAASIPSEEHADPLGAFVLEARVQTASGTAQSPADSPRAIVEFDTGAKLYRLQFGENSSGNQQVALAVDGADTVIGGLDQGFHTYKLVVDENGSGSLYIDGNATPVVTGYEGIATIGVQNRLRFGSVAGNLTGTANYALVQVSAIPEPAAAATTTMFSTILLLWRRH